MAVQESQELQLVLSWILHLKAYTIYYVRLRLEKQCEAFMDQCKLLWRVKSEKCTQASVLYVHIDTVQENIGH